MQCFNVCKYHNYKQKDLIFLHVELYNRKVSLPNVTTYLKTFRKIFLFAAFCKNCVASINKLFDLLNLCYTKEIINKLCECVSK